MSFLSHANPTPKDVTESMVTSWRRCGKISEAYAATARNVIERVQYMGSDIYNHFALDYALLRALMRLDKEGVYIYPGVCNIQMGNDRLLQFVRDYDAEHAGEFSIVKNPKKLKCKPEEVAMIVASIIVYTSCLYALRMHKTAEVRNYLSIMDEKNATHRGRVWLQEELQDFLRKNRRFSENQYVDTLCQYLIKPAKRTVTEKETRLW